ncbi:MAG: flavodoxin family protein [Thermoproteota archaeon]
MEVLGVCTSPHTEGISAKLVRKILEGAKEENAKVKEIMLSGVRLEHCRGCYDAECWSRMTCNIEDDAIRIREEVNKCNGLVFVAPVYFLSLNGLAKNFIDRMRNYAKETKPCVVVTVAGGTGKGCITALQEACRWLILIGFYPIVAEPVTRYNLDVVLPAAKNWGKKLVKSAGEVKKLSNLYEKVLAYEKLPYMRYTLSDELMYLSEVEISAINRRGRPELVYELSRKLEEAKALVNLGKFEEALSYIVEVQESAMKIFNELR